MALTTKTGGDMRPILGHGGRDLTFLVIVLETNFVLQAMYRVSASGSVAPHGGQPQRWDCGGFIDDRTGTRLMEEILRRARAFQSSLKANPDAIAITLPGTLDGHSTIVRSVRLGIFERINVSAFFQQQHAPPCYVFHDTECLALGEAVHGALKDVSTGEGDHYNFAYVFADEGIGSDVFINGQVHKGNGSAGHLGRLVLMPVGQYHPAFSSCGSVEVFAARPWVSKNMVQTFLSLKGKWGQEDTSDQTFRSMLLTASEKEEDWQALTYPIMAAGLQSHDPIAVSVLDDAAYYLGMAVNCLIAIVNPPAIVMGGGMITQLPGFYERVVSFAREFSWVTAWNRTTIKAAVLDREGQVYGAIEKLRPLVAQ